MLANVFVWSPAAFYDVYAAGERTHDISPQSDQVVAGSIMMVEGSILTICLFCWLFLRSAREGQERQELLELAAARRRRARRAARGARRRGRARRGAAGADRAGAAGWVMSVACPTFSRS